MRQAPRHYGTRAPTRAQLRHRLAKLLNECRPEMLAHYAEQGLPTAYRDVPGAVEMLEEVRGVRGG